MKIFYMVVCCAVLFSCPVAGFCQAYTDRDDIGFDRETGLWEYEDRSVTTPMYDHYNRSYELADASPIESGEVLDGEFPGAAILEPREAFSQDPVLRQHVENDEPDEGSVIVEKKSERK